MSREYVLFYLSHDMNEWQSQEEEIRFENGAKSKDIAESENSAKFENGANFENGAESKRTVQNLKMVSKVFCSFCWGHFS